MEARNPQYNIDGTVDLEINHPVFGWVPFTASPDDPEESGRMLYAKAINGDFGEIAIYVLPEKTPEEILAEKKKERQRLVDAIKVTVSTGKVFDGDETSQSRMAKAIQVAEIAGINETTWVLANNVPTVVTLDELKEALVLSLQEMGAVWAMPYV